MTSVTCEQNSFDHNNLLPSAYDERLRFDRHLQEASSQYDHI